MARQKNTPDSIPEPNVDEGKLSLDMSVMRYEAGMLAGQVTERQNAATALAKEIGYEGAMTLGALEDEIRFYQRRTVEACLELGKRLLVLKELTPRGEFDSRVDLLGFSRRSAYRFMGAAGRVGKSANLALLSTQVKSASAFLELVTEDDEAVLESIAKLDDVDRMSASELRAAVREVRAEHQALEEVSAEKSKKIDTLQKSLRRINVEPPADTLKATMKEATEIANDALACVRGGLRHALIALDSAATDGGDKELTVFKAGLLGQLQAELTALREEFNLPDLAGAEVPDWVRFAQAEAAGQGPQG